MRQEDELGCRRSSEKAISRVRPLGDFKNALRLVKTLDGIHTARCLKQIENYRMPKSSGVPLPSGPMIIPTSAPDKSLNAVWLKDNELELRRIESREDAARLQRAMSHLQESGWYWGPLTAAQAKQVLIDAPEGTFLLRDSSYQGYLLTLSVKTSLGPTHLRIEHATGMFGFDSVIVARPRLRRFEGAVDLVQHYALTYKHLATQNDTGGGNPSVPTEKTLQLKLTRPLHKVSPSLQHLCRITINQHSCCHQDLPLPRRLRDFLLEYPFVL